MSSAHLMARTLLFSIPALVGRAGFHCMTVHFCSFLWFGGWECEWGDQVIATYWLICEFDTGSVHRRNTFWYSSSINQIPCARQLMLAFAARGTFQWPVVYQYVWSLALGDQWPTCPMLRPASQCCPHRDPQRSSSRSFVHALTWGINLAIMTNVGLPRDARHRHVAFSLLSRNTLVDRNCGISSQHFWFPMIIRDGFSTHQSSAHVLQILQFVFNKTRQSRKDYRLQSQSVMVGCKQWQKTVTLTSNVAINPSTDREMSAKNLQTLMEFWQANTWSQLLCCCKWDHIS